MHQLVRRDDDRRDASDGGARRGARGVRRQPVAPVSGDGQCHGGGSVLGRVASSVAEGGDGVVSRIRRSTGNVIRRLRVFDAETGQELDPLTLQDMVDSLPGRVRLALQTLPAVVQNGLARLPRQAQLALIRLPEDTQLAIIAALQSPLAPTQPAVLALPAPDGGGQRPSGRGLPPDLVEFLLGRGGPPPWLRDLDPMQSAHRRAPPSGPLLLTGPVASMGDIRPPDLSPEGRQQRRIAYGNELAANRPRPKPSGAKVGVAAEVAAVAAQHPAKAHERAERERDEKWSRDAAAAHGRWARQAASDEHAAAVAAADTELKKQQAAWKPSGSKRDRRHAVPPASLVKAQQSVEALQTPPDLAAVEQGADAERRADLALLRSAGLSRDVIDALILALGDDALHTVLGVNGVPTIARLARRLPAIQVAALLAAGGGKLPAITDPVADALVGLFASGATAALVVTALKQLAGQAPLVFGEPAPTCLRLLQLPDLGVLKSVCAGKQLPQVVTLLPHISNPLIGTLLDLLDAPADLTTLCGPGPLPLKALLQATVAPPVLRSWCRGPILPSTVQLLGRVDFVTVVPILPVLGDNACGPVQLLAPLRAGADAAQVCQAVAGAKSVLKTPAQALQHFVANPGHTNAQFRAAAARAVATTASAAPTDPVTKYAASGASYTDWTHHAKITSAELHMLLNEGLARIDYADTFKTTTESVGGGDTEEYHVWIHDGAQWRRRWVVHLHRKKGNSKKDAPIAMHIKRWEHRQLKDANRYPIDSAMAVRCREKNNT